MSGEVVGRIGWNAITLVCRECYTIWIGVVADRDAGKITCAKCGSINIVSVDWLDEPGESLREFKNGRWVK